MHLELPIHRSYVRPHRALADAQVPCRLDIRPTADQAAQHVLLAFGQVEPGAGLVDEVTGPLLFDDPASKSRVSWVPQAGEVFFYFVRATGSFVGSWGADSAGGERVPVCAP